MHSCFIISPIGEAGTETRINADDLLDLIIRPALEPFDFDVTRGDHHSEPGKIDVDVVRAVQESDLCIVDISMPNPNVYYELGRRDETGKPLILLRSKAADELPVDIAARRYIEYDLDSRHGIRDAVVQLKSFVEPIVKAGFASSGSGASLVEIAEMLKRVERKIDRLENTGSKSKPEVVIPDEQLDGDPLDVYRLAIRQRNIPLAEKAMQALSYRMTKLRWLDQVVESVAAIGSIKAGAILVENAREFMDSDFSFHDKVDYLGCLVSNLNRTDTELEHLELVESLAESLIAISAHESAKDRVQIYNQLNRVYHGIYATTRDPAWLGKAIEALQRAMDITDTEGYLWYNLAICLKSRGGPGDREKALEYVVRCISLEGSKPDDDHLEMACTLMHDMNRPELSDYMDKLEAVNPVKAMLLRSRWGR